MMVDFWWSSRKKAADPEVLPSSLVACVGPLPRFRVSTHGRRQHPSGLYTICQFLFCQFYILKSSKHRLPSCASGNIYNLRACASYRQALPNHFSIYRIYIHAYIGAYSCKLLSTVYTHVHTFSYHTSIFCITQLHFYTYYEHVL